MGTERLPKICHTRRDRKNEHSNEGDNSGKQLLEKPNKCRPTGEILVNEEKRRKWTWKFYDILYIDILDWV